MIPDALFQFMLVVFLGIVVLCVEPPGSTVTVEARADARWVRVSVGDDGPGLPPGDPALLFLPFQRRGSRAAGAGLGLAICKTIIAAHGGAIVARRNELHGAAFEFTLPVAPRELDGYGGRAGAPPDRPSAPRARAGAGHRDGSDIRWSRYGARLR